MRTPSIAAMTPLLGADVAARLKREMTDQVKALGTVKMSTVSIAMIDAGLTTRGIGTFVMRDKVRVEYVSVPNPADCTFVKVGNKKLMIMSRGSVSVLI